MVNSRMVEETGSPHAPRANRLPLASKLTLRSASEGTKRAVGGTVIHECTLNLDHPTTEIPLSTKKLRV